MSNLLLEYRLRKLERLIFNEAKQVGTLYHICALQDYIKYIVPKDQLKASGEYMNFLYGDDDYVSFTRNKNYNTSHDKSDDTDIFVRLVVDGDKLSEHYKIGTYNDAYWDRGSEDEDGRAFGGLTGDDDSATLREQEEVVKGPIKNISKYIKELQLDVATLDEDTVKTIKSLPRKKALLGTNIVYNNFIKRKSPTLRKAIRDAGLKDGDDLATTVKLLIEASKNDVEPMIFSEDIGKVEQAIDAGADLDKEYNRGYPVTFYSNNRSLDILKMLLDAGASTDCPNDPPLVRACDFSGSPEVVKLLLKHGADPNVTNKDGISPIYAAATNNKYALKMIKLLLNAGANIEDVYRKNKYGVTGYSRAYPEVKEFIDSVRK